MQSQNTQHTQLQPGPLPWRTSIEHEQCMVLLLVYPSVVLFALLIVLPDWLYGDGDDAAKDDYSQKMADLKKLGEPPIMRHQAFMAVAPAVKSFKTKAAELSTQAANTVGKLDHIPTAELQSVINKANEITAWIDSELAKNNSAPKTAPPPMSASVVAAKPSELTTFALPILNTPKAKGGPQPEGPKAEEAPKEGEAPASPTPEGEAPEKPAENKMDLD